MGAHDLLDGVPALPELTFGGETYEPARDHARLTTLLAKVGDLMKDGQWRTLRELADSCGGSEASVSARLRDIRRMGFTVERDYVSKGLFRYRVVA